VLRVGFSYWLPRGLLFAVLLLFPLSEGGNGAWGLALGLCLIPAIFLYCLAHGEIRLSPVSTIALLLYLAVALTTTSYFYPSMKTVAFIVCALSAFALGASCVRRPGSWRWLVGVAAASGFLVGLYGLFLYSPHLGAISAEHKLASTFGLHNSAAAFFLLTWPLAFALVGRKQGLAFAVSGLAVIVALLLTFSRAAYIAFALQLVYLGIVWFRSRGAPREVATRKTRSVVPQWVTVTVCIVVLALVALGFASFFSAVGHRVVSIFNAADYSLGGRLTFWRAALQMFAHFPLFGVGLGNFGFHFTYLQPNWYYYSTEAHGLIFKFLAEGGLVGLVFLGALGWLFLRSLKRSGEPGQALSGWPRNFLVAGLLGYFLHSLVDFDWTYLANVVFFAVLAGVAVGTEEPREEHAERSRSICGRRLAVKIVTILVSVGLLVQIAVGAALSLERFWLDRGRITGATDALARASAVMPLNASTRIDLALQLMNEHPPSFEGAAVELRVAQRLNPFESQTYFLLSQLPAGDLEERIRLAQRAIQLDPFNRPQYYLGLSRLYRLAGDEEAERSTLVMSDHRFGITERIPPDFPRPLWTKYNVTFAAMYRRLAELSAKEDPALSELYAEIAARFGEAE